MTLRLPGPAPSFLYNSRLPAPLGRLPHFRTHSPCSRPLSRPFSAARNDRLLKQYRREVELINALEPSMAKLTDAELAAQDAGAEAEDRLRRDARLDPARGLRRGFARRASACSACATSTCSWWAASRCTRGKIAEDAHRRGQDAGGHAAFVT